MQGIAFEKPSEDERRICCHWEWSIGGVLISKCILGNIPLDTLTTSKGVIMVPVVQLKKLRLKEGNEVFVRGS